MFAFTAIILLLVHQIQWAHALYVATGSPCSSTCNATAGGTWITDLVCSTSDFDSTPKGQLLKSCMQCLSTSTYINSSYTDGNTDQYWELFHLKYVQQFCLTDKSTTHIAAVNACTSACTSLTPVLTTLWISSHPFLGQYDYCTENSSTYPQNAGDCAECLQGQKESVYIGNFMDTMNQACSSRPYIVNGNLVATPRPLFDADVISTATQSSTNSATSAPTSTNTQTHVTATATATAGQSSPTADTAATSATSHHGLGAGAIAGIAVAVSLIGLAIIAGLVFVLWRRRKSSKVEPAESIDSLNQESYSADAKDAKYTPGPAPVPTAVEKPASSFDGQIHEAPNSYNIRFSEMSNSHHRLAELPGSSAS